MLLGFDEAEWCNRLYLPVGLRREGSLALGVLPQRRLSDQDCVSRCDPLASGAEAIPGSAAPPNEHRPKVTLP